MKKVFIVKERCTGCMSCVVACQKTHADSEFYAPIRDTEPSRFFVQAAESGPVPLVCRHCEDPACVKACISGAMQKDEETGIVSNEDSGHKCIGCWMCVMACPFGTINPAKAGDGKKAVKCDLCRERGNPACAEACPAGAAVYMTEEEFSEYKREQAVQNSQEG